VTGTDADNCPYMRDQATAEYKTISGCDVIPTEQVGGPGSRCKHWSENCLDSELMTTALNIGGNPLSRITVGGLEDLGYVVDYDNAATFTKDDINPSCLCNNRKERQLLRHNSTRNLPGASLFNGKHGDVVFLNDLVPCQSTRKNRERRLLSETLRQHAIAYGLEILNESAARNSWASAVLDVRNKAKWNVSDSKPQRARYVGHYYMSVIMRQGDDFFGVLVVRDENQL
jgi:Leishmanolysin